MWNIREWHRENIHRHSKYSEEEKCTIDGIGGVIGNQLINISKSVKENHPHHQTKIKYGSDNPESIFGSIIVLLFFISCIIVNALQFFRKNRSSGLIV